MEREKIVRVTETEFELSNGVVYPHVAKLDHVPSVEEFQEIYDQMFRLFQQQGLIDTDERVSEHTESGGHDGRESAEPQSVGTVGQD